MPETEYLQRTLLDGELIVTTGLVLQELLQGFNGPKAAEQLIERFADIPLLSPTRDTHIAAANLRNHCRRNGVQAGMVNVLIAQLCIENDLQMLATDQDFRCIARHSNLQVLAFKPQC